MGKERHLFTILIGVILPGLLYGQATDATWGGVNPWNSNGSWTYNAGPNVFPNAADTTARFTGNGAPQTVDFGQASITIGHLEITSGNYIFGGGGQALTFSTASGNATLDVTGGTGRVADGDGVTFTSPLVLTNSTASPFIFDNPNFEGGSNNITINQGEFQIINDGVLITTGDLSIQPSGTLTLQGGNESEVGSLSGSGQIDMSQSSFFNVGVGSSASTTFSGSIITGAMSRFAKFGNGILTLTGNNSGNNGMLFIIGGKIALSTEQNLGSPELTLFNGATLHVTGNTPVSNASLVFLRVGAGGSFEIDSSTSLTLNGVIDNDSGAGALTKTGEGTLILSAANLYTGPTTVNAGLLNVTGSIMSAATVNGGATLSMNGTTSAATTVNSLGTLKGTGTLQAVTISGGTIAPGNSIGTIHPASLSLDANSTTLIEIDPSNASKIEVTGAAMIDGHVQVNQNFGTYPPSGDYTILTAGGAITGAYNPTVLGGLPGFNFSLRSGSVILHYDYLGISTAGLTGSTLSFANYLNQNAPYSVPLQALIQLSGAALKNALNNASPARNAFATYVTQNTMFALSEILNSHLLDQRFFHTRRNTQPSVAALFSDMADTHLIADASDRMILPPNCDKYSFWVGALGEYSHQKSQDRNPEFNFLTGGALAGFDYYGTGHNLFGFSGGYAYTSLTEENDAGHGTINYYFGSIYDTVYYPNWYLELAVWGVRNETHNYRHISFLGFDATASATIRSWQLVPHLGIGYHTQYCWGDFEPFAQADCALSWQESFQEHGAGAFNMNQQSQTSQFLRSEAGFRFYESHETNWGAWMIMEKISYVYKKPFNTGQVAASIVGTSALFSVESFQGVQNLGCAGLEFLWRLGDRKRATFSLAYNGEMGSRYMSHEWMGRLMKDF